MHWGPTDVTFRRTLATLAISLAALAPFAAPSAAHARTLVALDSDVFVERAEAGSRSLERKASFSRGDRVVWFVSWTRKAGSGGFTLTNAVPRGVYFQGSADGDEEVSLDGGRTWGRLADLRVGARLATPEDVTHVRWHISAARAALGKGRIAYSGIVR